MAEENKIQENTPNEIAPAEAAKIDNAAPEAKVDNAAPAMADANKNARGFDRKRNFKGKRGFGRGRGEGMPEEFEQKMSAKEIYQALVSYLRDEGRKRGIQPVIPSQAAITKRITVDRKVFNELPRDEKDTPWSVVTVGRYPISPDMIPIVLYMSANIKTKHFTLRDAQWVARLYPLLKHITFQSASRLLATRL